MNDFFGINDGAKPIPSAPPLSMLSTHDCDKYVDRDYLLKGVISPGDIGCIFGAPGSGKSVIAAYLAYSIAGGASVFGMRSRKGSVIYVAAEDIAGMPNRVRALTERYGHNDYFKLIPYSGNLYYDENLDALSLSDTALGIGASLIIIDTLASAFPGLEENDAASMGRVVHCAERLVAATGAAVILVHHDTKSEGGTPRGHSILNGRLDMALQVRKAMNGQIEARLTKNRNGPIDRQITFKVASMELCIDSDGDPITAPICQEFIGSVATGAAKLSPAESEALALLVEMEALGPVRELDWLAACATGQRVSMASQRVSRQRVVRRIAQGLRSKGLLEIEGEYVSNCRSGHSSALGQADSP